MREKTAKKCIYLGFGEKRCVVDETPLGSLAERIPSEHLEAELDEGKQPGRLCVLRRMEQAKCGRSHDDAIGEV